MNRSRSNQYVSFVLDRARAACRQEGYSRSTEDRYLYWVRRFLQDSDVASPGDLRAESARAFLRTLQECSYPTRKQARNALHFLFEEVLVGPTGGEIVLPGPAAQDQWGTMLQTGPAVGAEVRSTVSDRAVSWPSRGWDRAPRGDDRSTSGETVG